MAQEIDIEDLSAGVNYIQLEGASNKINSLTSIGIAVIEVEADNTLDAAILVSLAQSINGTHWYDISPATQTLNASEGKIIVTDEFLAIKLAIKIDIQTATTGILSVYSIDVDK